MNTDKNINFEHLNMNFETFINFKFAKISFEVRIKKLIFIAKIQKLNNKRVYNNKLALE